MKTYYTITLFLALILSIQGLQAKVIIVNNNEGQPADIENFSDNLQDVINSASPGDIIYVVGSPKNYSSPTAITINTNNLTLIGPGYLLGENKNVEGNEIQTQASLETAKISSLTINGNNILITGFDFGYNINNSVRVNGQNVELNRNRIALLYISGNSTLARENLVLRAVYLSTGSSSSMILNNLFLGDLNQDGNSQGISNIEITNNTFNAGFSSFEHANIYNNIFIKNDKPLSNCTNNTFSHNVFTASKEIAFPGNQNNTFENLDNIFSQAESTLFDNTEQVLDGDYELKDDSPVKGKGIGGIDPGAFTEDNSYKRSGLPAVPAVYEFTTPGVGTAKDGMTVTIKAKSHN